MRRSEEMANLWKWIDEHHTESQVEAEVCFQCGDTQSMMIGDEDKPIARFCAEHAAKFMKSNQKRRGDLLAFLGGWIEARRRAERAAPKRGRKVV